MTNIRRVLITFPFPSFLFKPAKSYIFILLSVWSMWNTWTYIERRLTCWAVWAKLLVIEEWVYCSIWAFPYILKNDEVIFLGKDSNQVSRRVMYVRAGIEVDQKLASLRFVEWGCLNRYKHLSVSITCDCDSSVILDFHLELLDNTAEISHRVQWI